MNKKISIVIPVYNEELNIDFIADQIKSVCGNINYAFELIFIDDGSHDRTLSKIKSLQNQDSNIFYIEFSRNFGKENALKAGYDYATGDCIITLDGDMQHPPEMIGLMLTKWEEGFDIVSAQRTYNQSTNANKIKWSNLFYTTINLLSDTKLERGSSDFKLIDSSVAKVLRNLNENGIFMRGLIKWLGFKTTSLSFTANERNAGETKFSFIKLFKFAIEGITSFSVKPLTMAVYLGFTFSVLSLLYIPYVIYEHYQGRDIPGWATVVVAVIFLGGLQLIILGIIGIYIGKLFIQSKQRPNYIVRNTNIK